MPTQVIRNGKTYTEYSPQELAEIRNELLTNYYIKRGGKHSRHVDRHEPYFQGTGKTRRYGI